MNIEINSLLKSYNFGSSSTSRLPRFKSSLESLRTRSSASNLSNGFDSFSDLYTSYYNYYPENHSSSKNTASDGSGRLIQVFQHNDLKKRILSASSDQLHSSSYNLSLQHALNAKSASASGTSPVSISPSATGSTENSKRLKDGSMIQRNDCSYPKKLVQKSIDSPNIGSLQELSSNYLKLKEVDIQDKKNDADIVFDAKMCQDPNVYLEYEDIKELDSGINLVSTKMGEVAYNNNKNNEEHIGKVGESSLKIVPDKKSDLTNQMPKAHVTSPRGLKKHCTVPLSDFSSQSQHSQPLDTGSPSQLFHKNPIFQKLYDATQTNQYFENTGYYTAISQSSISLENHEKLPVFDLNILSKFEPNSQDLDSIIGDIDFSNIPEYPPTTTSINEYFNPQNHPGSLFPSISPTTSHIDNPEAFLTPTTHCKQRLSKRGSTTNLTQHTQQQANNTLYFDAYQSAPDNYFNKGSDIDSNFRVFKVTTCDAIQGENFNLSENFVEDQEKINNVGKFGHGTKNIYKLERQPNSSDFNKSQNDTFSNIGSNEAFDIESSLQHKSFAESFKDVQQKVDSSKYNTALPSIESGKSNQIDPQLQSIQHFNASISSLSPKLSEVNEKNILTSTYGLIDEKPNDSESVNHKIRRWSRKSFDSPHSNFKNRLSFSENFLDSVPDLSSSPHLTHNEETFSTPGSTTVFSSIYSTCSDAPSNTDCEHSANSENSKEPMVMRKVVGSGEKVTGSRLAQLERREPEGLKNKTNSNKNSKNSRVQQFYNKTQRRQQDANNKIENSSKNSLGLSSCDYEKNKKTVGQLQDTKRAPSFDKPETETSSLSLSLNSLKTKEINRDFISQYNIATSKSPSLPVVGSLDFNFYGSKTDLNGEKWKNQTVIGQPRARNQNNGTKLKVKNQHLGGVRKGRNRKLHHICYKSKGLNGDSFWKSYEGEEECYLFKYFYSGGSFSCSKLTFTTKTNTNFPLIYSLLSPTPTPQYDLNSRDYFDPATLNPYLCSKTTRRAHFFRRLFGGSSAEGTNIGGGGTDGADSNGNPETLSKSVSKSSSLSVDSSKSRSSLAPSIVTLTRNKHRSSHLLGESNKKDTKNANYDTHIPISTPKSSKSLINVSLSASFLLFFLWFS